MRQKFPWPHQWALAAVSLFGLNSTKISFFFLLTALEQQSYGWFTLHLAFYGNTCCTSLNRTSHCACPVCTALRQRCEWPTQVKHMEVLSEAKTPTWIFVPGDALVHQSAATGCGRAEREAGSSWLGWDWQQTSQWLARWRRGAWCHSDALWHPQPPCACQSGWKPRPETDLTKNRDETMFK